MKDPICPGRGKRRLFLLATSALVFAGAASETFGQVITLNHQNSQVQINTGSQAGMFNWSINGNDYLAQQWFWYRTGSMGSEQSINTIGPALNSTFDPTRNLTTTYNNATLGVTVDYLLTGFSASSGKSQINESIVLTNNTASPLTISFFQYSDFDLSGSDGVILSQGPPDNLWVKAVQTNSFGVSLSEEITGTVVPHANRAQASVFPVLLNSLNDGSVTVLNNTAGAGPGDVNWAFEWDITLNPAGTAGSDFGISKLKTLQVPEPSAGLLIPAGMALLAWKRRKASVRA
jgi:hypothetical protein